MTGLNNFLYYPTPFPLKMANPFIITIKIFRNYLEIKMNSSDFENKTFISSYFFRSLE